MQPSSWRIVLAAAVLALCWATLPATLGDAPIEPAVAECMRAGDVARTDGRAGVPMLERCAGLDPGFADVRLRLALGRPLVGPDADARERRRATEVVAASYGAVWGVLRQNGHRLYIVDANHGRDYAYDRPVRGAWAPAALTDGGRVANQRAIREYIEEIAREYRVPAGQ